MRATVLGGTDEAGAVSVDEVRAVSMDTVRAVSTDEVRAEVVVFVGVWGEACFVRG